MVGVREEVELSGIVETFLRHASCRFNRDAPDLRPRPGAGRPRKIDPQLAQPAEIERRPNLSQVAAFDDDFVAVGLDRQQLGFAQRVDRRPSRRSARSAPREPVRRSARFRPNSGAAGA